MATHDSRPIATTFLAGLDYRSPTNPRGWNPTIFPNFTTAAPLETQIAVWKSDFTAYFLSDLLPNGQEVDAKGLVLWDGFSGQQYEATIYDGDPSYEVPEVPLESILYVRDLCAAHNWRLGGTIRPTKLDPQNLTQTFEADPVQTYREKLLVARELGWTLVWFDSSLYAAAGQPASADTLPFAAADVAALAAEFPEIDMVWEWWSPSYAGIVNVRAYHDSGYGYNPSDVVDDPTWDAKGTYYFDPTSDPSDPAQAAAMAAAFARGAECYFYAGRNHDEPPVGDTGAQRRAIYALWLANFHGALALDYETLAYQRLWELLNAHAPLTDASSATYVRPGNRVRWDNAERLVQRKPEKSHGDFRQIEIRTGDFTDSLFAAVPHRYAYTPGFDPTQHGWSQAEEYTFLIVLTHTDQRLGRNNPFEREVRRAIAKGGPRWGKQWIQRVGPMTGTREPAPTDDSGGSERMTTLIRLPVAVLFDGRTQLV